MGSEMCIRDRYYIGDTDYLCECQTGYEGKNCEKLVEEENPMEPGYIVLIVLIVLTCILVLGISVYMYSRREQRNDESNEETVGQPYPLNTMKT